MEKLNPGDIVMWYPQGVNVRPFVCSVARILTVEDGPKPLIDESTRMQFPELSDEEFEESKQAEWYEATKHPNMGPENPDLIEGNGLVFCWHMMKKSEPECKPRILWRQPPYGVHPEDD
jgi:hypothetical protein